MVTQVVVAQEQLVEIHHQLLPIKVAMAEQALQIHLLEVLYPMLAVEVVVASAD
jgi:hypothetical protein